MEDFLFSKKEQDFHLIIESIDNLCRSKANYEFEKLNKREKEKLASKNLTDLLFQNTSLSHNKYGAPVLSNGKAISLSHSNNFLALMTAKNTAAVDIQLLCPKAFKLQSKFLHEEELPLVQSQVDATILWCAKECLYKIHQKGNLIFSKDLRIHKVNTHKIDCSMLGKIYCLNYKIIEGLCVVYYFD